MKTLNRQLLLGCLLCLSFTITSTCLAETEPNVIDLSNFVLQWRDEFDYADEDLDVNWVSQNSPFGGFVLCSRWRENAMVHDGILELINRKESRGGQEWTSGSVWTKQTFGYGGQEFSWVFDLPIQPVH